MIKIITFLGTSLGKPGSPPPNYQFQNKVYKGAVFAEALHQFCQYDEMLVCITDKARATTWTVLEKLQDPRIKDVSIPTGRSTEEMWQIFILISEYVHKDDQVIFDITHGLRSLPFLVFLFAAYLKEAKNVKIEAIYYGALELSQTREDSTSVTPVIDLSEFVSMLDWLTATERFIEIGDGQALSKLLYKSIPSNEDLKNNPSVRPFKDPLNKTAKAIENISLALSLARPLETMKSASNLELILEKSNNAIKNCAKPFSLLTDKIIEEYGQFALDNCMNPENIQENLELQP